MRVRNPCYISKGEKKKKLQVLESATYESADTLLVALGVLLQLYGSVDVGRTLKVGVGKKGEDTHENGFDLCGVGRRCEQGIVRGSTMKNKARK